MSRSTLTAETVALGTQTQRPTHGHVTDGCNPAQRAGAGAAEPLSTRSSWSDLRATRGYSLRELQDRTGINRGDLSKIEHGRMCPSPDQARRILEATS